MKLWCELWYHIVNVFFSNFLKNYALKVGTILWYYQKSFKCQIKSFRSQSIIQIIVHSPQTLVQSIVQITVHSPESLVQIIVHTPTTLVQSIVQIIVQTLVQSIIQTIVYSTIYSPVYSPHYSFVYIPD